MIREPPQVVAPLQKRASPWEPRLRVIAAKPAYFNQRIPIWKNCGVRFAADDGLRSGPGDPDPHGGPDGPHRRVHPGSHNRFVQRHGPCSEPACSRRWAAQRPRRF